MVVDVGVVKNHIKPKADSTLHNMKKADLIEYIRTLEHNYNVVVSFNENQAKYIESLNAVEVKDKELLMAIKILVEQYGHSKQSDYVHSPIAHALYHTWKKVDEEFQRRKSKK